MSTEPILTDSTALSSYHGVPAPRTFTGSSSEYRALRECCGVVSMPWRAKLIVTGADRVRWLNGMVTNNIRDLALNRGVYSFLLTAQGRILGDMDVYQRGDYLLIITDTSQKKTVYDTLDHFIIMDDVELKDISEKLTSIQVIGPESRNALLKAGVTVPQLESMQVIDLDWNGCGISLARGGSPHFEAYEIWVSPGHVERLLTEFKDAGAARVGTEALEMFRISQGIPAYGQDIWERYLPQETNQAHALHFVKGCYVGQEIVERIRARANVHRGLVGFVVDGHLPAVGSKVQLNGKDVGEVTSSVSVPTQAGSANIALGYLRHEAGGPGTEVQIEKVRARVAALPFEL